LVEFERQARKLIECDQINTLFGCGTSAIRKAVLPVLEQFNALLWYPMPSEGLESSPNVFYTGSCPNQQVEPAVTWLLHHPGKRFYLLGSEDVFPHTVNPLIKAQLQQQDGTLVGEEYAALGTKDFTKIITQIQQAKPDIVFNTLMGDSNIAFYRQYQESGLTADEIPILSCTVSETELHHIGEAAVGHYSCWSYFQSLETPRNRQFVENFQRRYGTERVTSDPIEAAYTQVYLWKQAVELFDSFEVERVRVAAYGQSFDAPSGLVRIEPNHHVGRTCRIGRILATGQFEIIYTSDRPIKPLPWLGVEELKSGRLKVARRRRSQRVGLKNSVQSANVQPTDLKPENPEMLGSYSNGVVKEMLAQVSQGIHKISQFEQKIRELEVQRQELQREITQRQRVEAVLRDSESELHALLASITDVVLIFDAQGRYLKIAPTNLALLHKKADELIGKTLHEVFPQVQADTFLTYIRQSLEAQQTLEVEYNHPTLEKPDVGFAATIAPLGKDSVIWIARDITERKQAEEDLRESEEKYRLLFSSELDAISLFDVETGQILEVNPAFLELYGYTKEEALHLTPAEVSAQPEMTHAAIKQAGAKGSDHVLLRWHKKKDGTLFPVELCAGTFIWKGRQLMCAVARDITEREQAAEALRESEARFRVAAEASLDAFFIFESLRDETGRIIDFTFADLNSKAEKMISMSKAEVIGKRMCELLPINRTGGFLEKYIRVVETGIPLEEEFPLSTPEVKASWLHHQVVPLRDGIAITARDITERKRSEDALKESEARLRLALEAAQMGIWDWNILSDELVYSEQLGPVFGLPSGIYHPTFEALLNSVHPEDRDRVIQAVARAIGEATDYAVEFRVICPDGTLRWVGNKGQVYYDETGLPVRMLGVAMNITDRKLATEALQQSEERMRALLNAIPDRMFRHRIDGTYLDVKVQEGDIISSSKTLIGKNLHDTPMPDEVKNQMLRLLQIAVQTGDLQTYEHNLPKADGVKSYEARIVKSGIDEAVCIVRDITERKQSEEALRQQKEILQSIFDHIPIMVVFYDATGQMLLLNREVERVLGWSIEEVETIDLLAECYPDPEYRQQVLDFMLTPTRKWHDFKTRTKDGSILDTSWTNIPLSDGTSIGIGQDITERKQVEQARRQAEKRYRSIFENTVEGLFQIAPDGRILNANPGLARIYGYDSPEELIADFTHLNQQRYLDQGRWAEFLALMQTQEQVLDFESQVYRKDGKVVWISENAHIVRDVKGELLYYEGSVVDITKRKVWEEALRYQQECSEQLLLNILPSPIAARLKLAESTIADSFASVTVLFADLVNFTEFSSQIPATQLVELLNKIFSKFDQLAQKHGLEKIKTIGDAYMVVGGLPESRADHAEAIAEMALAMQREITRFVSIDGEPFRLRIGINTGPVVAGVIGTQKFAYDLWGDTVNVASRMESQGVAGRIQVTATTYELLKDKYLFEQRGTTHVKGKGEMITYWLIEKKS
ncbi:MAG: transporter substrate-binding protein, partial [Cyanobacteriota bacterium]